MFVLYFLEHQITKAMLTFCYVTKIMQLHCNYLILSFFPYNHPEQLTDLINFKKQLEKLSSIEDQGQTNRVTVPTCTRLWCCHWPWLCHATRLTVLVLSWWC